MKQFISDFQKTLGFKFCGWVSYLFIILEIISYIVISNSSSNGEFGWGGTFAYRNLLMLPPYVISYIIGSIVGIIQRGKYKKSKTNIKLSIGYLLGLILIVGTIGMLGFVYIYDYFL